MKKTKILSPVYNPIEYDGRVKRAADTLCEIADVTVFCPYSGIVDSPKENFRVIRINTAFFPTFKYETCLKLLFFSLCFFFYCFKTRPDIIYAHDIYLMFPGWIAAKAANSKIIYDAHELTVPEKEIPMSFFNKIFYMVERWATKYVDRVITANEERALIMQKHHGLGKTPTAINNIHPVENQIVDVKEILKLYPQVKQFKKEEDCIVVYSGFVDLSRGVERFIKGVLCLPKKYKMIVIGGGHSLEVLKSRYSQSSNRILFLGRMPRLDMLALLKVCDVGVVTYPYKGLNNIYCASNKIYEYAQAGLPMISTAQPPLEKKFKQFSIGKTVPMKPIPNGDEEFIANVIAQIFQEKDIYYDGLNQLIKLDTWDNESRKLLALFRELF